jgi:Holliday junction resolvase YEN1
MLNTQQIIDGVLSDDADTLLFGATHLIRKYVFALLLKHSRSHTPLPSPNVKEDGDMIKIYTAQAIQSTLSLTAGGILLLALLCGGDYDPVSE